MIASRQSRPSIIRRGYFGALRLAGTDERALRRHARHDRVLILNLHGVSPEVNAYGPSLHPERFRQLLAWLRPRVIFSRLRDLPEQEHDPRRPLVVLSFDDGLMDFVQHAMPVLATFGVHANQNLIGESVERGEPPWTIHLVDLLGASPVELVQRLRIPGFEGALTGDDDYAKERYGAALTNHFKRLAPGVRERSWDALEAALQGVVVDRPTRMMSAESVAAALSAGHEIGSHSYSHESMEHLSDAAFLEDFHRSRAVLAGIGCEECTIYAFPNGSHRRGQAELLQQAGVRSVLLVGERPSLTGASVHTRMTVRGGSAAELRARATHGLGIAR